MDRSALLMLLVYTHEPTKCTHQKVHRTKTDTCITHLSMYVSTTCVCVMYACVCCACMCVCCACMCVCVCVCVCVGVGVQLCNTLWAPHLLDPIIYTQKKLLWKMSPSIYSCEGKDTHTHQCKRPIIAKMASSFYQNIYLYKFTVEGGRE